MSGTSEAAKRGRRNWSLEDKWQIVEEARLPGNSVAEVARRRGVNSNLLFRWRRTDEAWQLGHPSTSLMRLPKPTLDFIPIGVFGEVMTKDQRWQYRAPPAAPVTSVESSMRPKSVLPPKGPTFDGRPGVIEIEGGRESLRTENARRDSTWCSPPGPLRRETFLANATAVDVHT
ncbi:transposase [Ensifer adhaerens]|uniref:transposase n=1 Tax=Ensifer adhaerens TaxID=106592 RepID=UPI000CF08F72|nr:transposase [Ensifer adhaerens]